MVRCNNLKIMKNKEDIMRNIMIFAVALVVLLSGCSVFKFKSGYFDLDDGNRQTMITDQFLYVGFVNEDSVPYTVYIWTKKNYCKHYLLKSIVGPGKVLVQTFSGGSCQLAIRRNVGDFTKPKTIILSDQGNIVLPNGNWVDMRIDLRDEYFAGVNKTVECGEYGEVNFRF